MSWKTPKTDYNTVYILGPSDLNRIEENTQYLKDYIEKDGLFVLPSNTIIMSADTERGGYNFSGVAKKFRVKYEGIYRIEFQAKGSGFPSQWVSVKSVDVDRAITQSIDGFYNTYNVEIYIPAGGELELSINYTITQGSGGYLYLRNARVKGTLMTRSDIPSNAVLQN